MLEPTFEEVSGVLQLPEVVLTDFANCGYFHRSSCYFNPGIREPGGEIRRIAQGYLT
jgi:hypothetical protein